MKGLKIPKSKPRDVYQDLVDLAKSPQELDGESSEIKQINRLIKERKTLLEAYLESKAQTDDLFKRLTEVTRVKIPELALSLGQLYYKLVDSETGETLDVEVVKDLTTSLTQGNKPDALKWVRDNGGEDLISNRLIVETESTEVKGRLETLLYKMGVDYRSVDDIHTARYKAFVRRKLEAGVNMDMETLGVYEVYDTKVGNQKTPKK